MLVVKSGRHTSAYTISAFLSGDTVLFDDAVEARRDAEEKYHQPLIDQKKRFGGLNMIAKKYFLLHVS